MQSMAHQIACSLRPAAAFLLTALLAVSANAQDSGYYQPLNQRTPLGQTAGWLTHINGDQSMWLQPVQIEVPGGGEVSVYSGAGEPRAVAASPAMVAVNAGHTYRLRLANMVGFPDAELYPSIEILDRLHPPAGNENRYPIPVPFSRGDIQQALAGRLVTRVIYLEQPQLAQQLDPLKREIPQSVLPSENALQEADRLGRPMIIVRIGGRRPSQFHTSSMFFGTGGAVQVRANEEQPPRVTRTALSVR
jgi:hypothetical protein